MTEIGRRRDIPAPSGPRCIVLRRPPVLSVMTEPFVPPHADLDDVDLRWAAIRDRNPSAFDGVALHVLGVHRNGQGGAVLHVVETSYRFHAVQSAEYDCGMRGLGVRGMTLAGEAALMGRRSRGVAHYPGRWEFAPAGGLEPDTLPATMFRRELLEETGLEVAETPRPVALFFDPDAKSWEIIYRLEIDRRHAVRAGAEYDELGFFERHELPDPLSPITRQMLTIW